MIESKTGDILREDVEALVNPVNCVGVMGKGLAAQFKRAFPENFCAYAAACEAGEVRPGRMLVFETGSAGSPRFIVNFPTKRHWKDRSRLADIEAGLAALRTEVERRCIRSVAVPALGAGLGGLPWGHVRERIGVALRDLPGTRVVVFEPNSQAGATPDRGEGVDT